MARTKNTVDENKLAHLKRMVETKFGRPIANSKDCNDLSNHLISFGGNVNPQTVRRLFGLVKTTNSPSLFTLNLLANYTQNCSWKQYQHHQEIDEKTNLLADLFFDFYADPLFGYLKVVDTICENEALQDMLLMRLATVKNAQEMFFENRPLRDALNKTTYKLALYQYIESKGSTNEAKLFGYGLLFWGAFLTENGIDISSYFKIIREIPLTANINNIPAARKFGIPLMYYHYKNDEKEFEKWFNKAMLKREDYIKLNSFAWESSNFDFVIIEHLLLIGRYSHAQKLWQQHLSDKKNYNESSKSYHYFNQYKTLIAAFCKKDFDKKVMSFDANLARSGERKFYTILFLIYKINHTSTTSKSKRLKLVMQLNQLINDTGYTWFYKLIEN